VLAIVYALATGTAYLPAPFLLDGEVLEATRGGMLIFEIAKRKHRRFLEQQVDRDPLLNRELRWCFYTTTPAGKHYARKGGSTSDSVDLSRRRYLDDPQKAAAEERGYRRMDEERRCLHIYPQANQRSKEIYERQNCRYEGLDYRRQQEC
jgi:hypothetical protein